MRAHSAYPAQCPSPRSSSSKVHARATRSQVSVSTVVERRAKKLQRERPEGADHALPRRAHDCSGRMRVIVGSSSSSEPATARRGNASRSKAVGDAGHLEGHPGSPAALAEGPLEHREDIAESAPLIAPRALGGGIHGDAEGPRVSGECDRAGKPRLPRDVAHVDERVLVGGRGRVVAVDEAEVAWVLMQLRVHDGISSRLGAARLRLVRPEAVPGAPRDARLL